MEISKEDKENLQKSLMDQLLFGESYVHVSEDGIKRLDPLDPKTQSLVDRLRPYSDVINLHSFMSSENLTLDQVIEKYHLTEEQVINLKKLIDGHK